MSQILARRAIDFFPKMLLISVIVFFILSLGPSPLASLQEVANLSPADIARLSHKYGWDQPLWRQYLDWLGRYLHGNWGISVRSLRPTWDVVMERLPLTLTIASLSLVISVGIGVPLGALAAVRRNSRADYGATFASLVLMAVPGFFMALVLQLVAVGLRTLAGHPVFYVSGTPEVGTDILGWIQRLTLPVLTLALTHIAKWTRYQRGELLGVLDQQYVTSARAKGMPGRHVFLHHSMRNALLPIITLIAIDLGNLVAGAVIVESVFGLPGIGTLLVDSVSNHDTDVVLAILMLVAGMMLVSNTIADVAYGALDPRVRVD